MPEPTFVQAGAGNVWQTGAELSVSLSGAVVGNIIIFHSLIDGLGNVAPGTITNIENLAGTDSAITDITPGLQVGNVAAARQGLHIGRALTSAPSVAFTQAGGIDVYARLYEFADVNKGTTLAEVIENVTEGSYVNGFDTTATIADTSVQTLGANRLACNFIAVNDDNQADFDTEAITGMSGGTWVSRGSYGTLTGTDGAIGLQTASMPAAGTINGGTLAMLVADAWGVIGLALKPSNAVPPFTMPRYRYN